MASTMFYYGCEDHSSNHHETHFLEACSMCQKPLGVNRDIFMYRGITAFCSDECRQEQIEMDEAEERSWKRRTQRKAGKKPVKGSTISVSASTATDAKSASAGAVSVA